MKSEEKITGLLEQILSKLDEHSKVLGEHSQILGEHFQILSALRTGQEYLKAEIDGLKVSNAKEFGTLKNNKGALEIDIKILKDQSWENKADIERIKNTMGMG